MFTRICPPKPQPRFDGSWNQDCNATRTTLVYGIGHIEDLASKAVELKGVNWNSDQVSVITWNGVNGTDRRQIRNTKIQYLRE
jgi:hypothetical protein